MVAYSFKRQFVPPILVGLGTAAVPGLQPKLQTIRAIGKRRHAVEGETVQLYCGMRTRQCFKIGEARCVGSKLINLVFGRQPRIKVGDDRLYKPEDLHAFAQRDGFMDWAELRAFWAKEHPGLEDFYGMVIGWEPMA